MMSQVQAFRDRARELGSRWRYFLVPGGSSLAIGGATAAARGSAELKSYVGGAGSRAETLLRRHVGQHGRVTTVLEIGRRGRSHADWFASGVQHDQRDVAVDHLPMDVVAALKEIPSGSYDVVYSVDVIEYVKAPWRVADEIARILKPGGITFHTTLFTTSYQPQPEDFVRFTPDGLKSLFDGLECLTAEFDATERRRDGGRKARVCPDIFGGSREGWRVHYAGRKTFTLR